MRAKLYYEMFSNTLTLDFWDKVSHEVSSGKLVEGEGKEYIVMIRLEK